MIRVAAVGDVHVGPDCAGCLQLQSVPATADLLLLAGDLTRLGDPSEAAILVDELAGVDVPTIAVLGNHDHHRDQAAEIADLLRAAGITVLEGDSVTVEIGDVAVGVAGAKGFGGGFAGACASDFGEPEMKAFIRHTKHIAAGIERTLSTLECDVKIALLHYSPIEATLQGERLDIYPFLGSYLLGEAIDRGGADVVFHGHAHKGSEKGTTPGGIKVRNVAKPAIGRPYSVFEIPVPEGSSRGLELAGRH